MLGIGQRAIGIADEDHVIIELHRVTRRGFAAAIGQRAGDDQRVDVARLQEVVQVARAGNEGAEALFLDAHVDRIVHLEPRPELPVMRAMLEGLLMGAAHLFREAAIEARPAVERRDGRGEGHEDIEPTRRAHRRADPVDLRHDGPRHRHFHRRTRFHEAVLHVDDEMRRPRGVDRLERVELATALTFEATDQSGIEQDIMHGFSLLCCAAWKRRGGSARPASALI